MSSRLSGSPGEVINLDVSLYKNGAPFTPYAIRRIDIYQDSVAESNLVAQVIIPDPDESDYPSPIEELAGTGNYRLPFVVPSTFSAPRAYFDVWRFIEEDPGSDGDLDDEDEWEALCGRFWLQPSGFKLDDGLETIDLGFEPLTLKFWQPEVKPLQSWFNATTTL